MVFFLYRLPSAIVLYLFVRFRQDVCRTLALVSFAFLSHAVTKCCVTQAPIWLKDMQL